MGFAAGKEVRDLIRRMSFAVLHPAWRALLQDIELMPQDRDFSFEPLARLEAVAQHADEKKGNCHHRPGSCSDSVRAATQADEVFGTDRFICAEFGSRMPNRAKGSFF